MPIRKLMAVTCLAGALAALQPSLGTSEEKVLRVVPHADLRSLDPIWTTAAITRNHGYLVYDVLFATDANFQIQPQMVEKWEVSKDGHVYTFTLRPNLKFHDGTPVRSADCIASIERWSKRDVLGQTLAAVTQAWTARDDRTFILALKKPFPFVLEALGKPASNVPFILPERLARTDAFTQITDPTGSGPFKMLKDQWTPGNKVVYAKNQDYPPRNEPPSWMAGGKVAKVDRIEWLYIPDPATVAAAINAGEVDLWELVPHDLVPVLAKGKHVWVGPRDALGITGILRFNHLQPPFNNVLLRRAVLAALDQNDYVSALAGDAANGKACPSFFACGTPLSNTASSELLTGKRDLDKARALVKESGYKGEKIVLLDATDMPSVHLQALLAQDLFKKLGLNVELAASDWGTLVTRRASREPVEKGGWSVFPTLLNGPENVSPASNLLLRGVGEQGYFGWLSDPKLEELREAFLEASTVDAQKKIAADIQRRAFEVVPYIPTAQVLSPVAYRKSLLGVLPAPIMVFWNIEK